MSFDHLTVLGVQRALTALHRRDKMNRLFVSYDEVQIAIAALQALSEEIVSHDLQNVRSVREARAALLGDDALMNPFDDVDGFGDVDLVDASLASLENSIDHGDSVSDTDSDDVSGSDNDS